MPGEKDLEKLLKSARPELHEGEYVFCTVSNIAILKDVDVVMTFKEAEGITVILKRSDADQLNLSYDFIAAWITLTVHSALNAVGLTAAFSKALADAGISCNVVAGYFHDHIFVGKADAQKSIDVLRSLSK